MVFNNIIIEYMLIESLEIVSSSIFSIAERHSKSTGVLIRFKVGFNKTQE